MTDYSTIVDFMTAAYGGGALHPQVPSTERFRGTVVPSVEGDRASVPDSGDRSAMEAFRELIDPPPDAVKP